MIKKIILGIAISIFHVAFSYSQEAETKRSVIFSKGEIVSSSTSRLSDGTFYRASKIEDETMIGVYSNTATIRKDLLIITEGQAEVLYDNSKPIKKGDLVTSSVDGKAIKFDGDGWILGVALEDAHGDFLKIRVDVQYR